VLERRLVDAALIGFLKDQRICEHRMDIAILGCRREERVRRWTLHEEHLGVELTPAATFQFVLNVLQLCVNLRKFGYLKT